VGIGTRLPGQLTSLIGRQEEVAAVSRALRTHRLVTISGPPGCGKTRLALAVARRSVRWRRGEEVRLLELAEVTDPWQAQGMLSAAVGVPDLLRVEPGSPEVEGTCRLVVLDGCERLLWICGRSAIAILRSFSGIRLLVSSREPLGIPGEVVWRLGPLPVPDPAAAEPSRLRDQDAVRLFTDRARAHRPSLRLDAGNLSVVATICEAVGGNPLAIELAAARLTALTPEQLAARLHEVPDLLATGSRHLPPRQRSLRASIDWSYDPLLPRERELLNRLSVFAAPADLAAVQFVCGQPGATGRTIDTLTRLIEKSLVQTQATAGELRYGLTEPVRGYAAQKLALAGEGERIRARQAVHYTDLAEAGDQGRDRPPPPEWTARLDLERPNLRAALAWSLRSRPELALRAAGALAWFWQATGALAEGRHWLDRALAASEAVDPTARSRAWYGAGRIAERQGDLAAARSLLHRAREAARRLGDRPAEGRALLGLGGVLLRMGDLAGGRSQIEAGLAVHRRLGDGLGTQQGLVGLGLAALMAGDHATARARLEEGAELARELDDEHGLAIAAGAMAELAMADGDLETAGRCLETSLRILRRLDVGAVARQLGGLARLAAARSEPERALLLGGAARRLRARLGVRPDLDWRRLEEVLARCRQALPVPVAEAAEARGGRLSLEEAIDRALDGSASRPAGEGKAPAGPAWASERSRAAGLSRREWEVLGLLIAGLSNRAIALRLTISPNTVNKHVASILEKLEARSRAQAAAIVLGIEGVAEGRTGRGPRHPLPPGIAGPTLRSPRRRESTDLPSFTRRAVRAPDRGSLVSFGWEPAGSWEGATPGRAR